ncbi:MAG: hypothetical protein U0931_17575 [Vulcanimicrobiota bacterium]
MSLAEAVVALFLLVAVVLTVLSFLSIASQSQHNTLKVLQASRFATQCLERVQAWGGQPANFANWAIYADQTCLAPDQPGLSCRIQAARKPISRFSPTLSLEDGWAPPRELPEAVVQLKVTAAWAGGRPPAVTLHSYVVRPLEPLPAVPGLKIRLESGTTTPMPRDSTAVYAVEFLDAAGHQIQGMTYLWEMLSDERNVPPHPGMGSFEPLDRVANRVAIKNHFYKGDPDFPTHAGDIFLRCHCRFGGREVTGDSARIVLLP